MMRLPAYYHVTLGLLLVIFMVIFCGFVLIILFWKFQGQVMLVFGGCEWVFSSFLTAFLSIKTAADLSA